MKRLRYLLLLPCLLLAVAGVQKSFPAIVQEGETSIEVALKEKYVVRDEADSRQERTIAVLRDARGLLRVLGERSQRVLPTSSQGNSSHRLAARLHTYLRHKSFIHQHLFDGKLRRESSPFCCAVSRRYYVIALRRLLC